jgi:hypothetical protein
MKVENFDHFVAKIVPMERPSSIPNTFRDNHCRLIVPDQRSMRPPESLDANRTWWNAIPNVPIG